MSKEKSPPAKKELSLKRDRRNTYGESPGAARKGIPRGKQRSHQLERSAVAQDLASLGPTPSEDEMMAAEGAAKATAQRVKSGAFMKKPDEPLGVVLEKKKAPRPAPKPKSRTRIMYIESKAQGLVGPARIGRVTFSKSGATVYYQGRAYQKFKGFKANHFDTETLDEYWISGPHGDGNDRLYAGGPPVHIDDDVWDEYWAEIRKLPAPKKP